MMRTTSLMVFAASIAIIFAFFYQVDTVGAVPKGRGSVARPSINYGAAAAGGKILVLFEANNKQQKEQVIRYLVKAYGA